MNGFHLRDIVAGIPQLIPYLMETTHIYIYIYIWLPVDVPLNQPSEKIEEL